jgi:hypothetical protein
VATTLLLLAYFPSAHSQTPFRPQHVYAPYYSHFEDQALYVGGGKIVNSLTTLSQAFAIDLSVSWNTSSPVFKQLPDFFAEWSSPSTITSDGNQWVVCSGNTVYAYTFSTEQWDRVLDEIDVACHSIQATTDPTTGIIYIPNAFDDAMMSLDLATKTSTKVPMPPSLTTLRSFSVAWNEEMGKMVLIGGSTEINNKLHMFSFNEQDGWMDLTKAIKDPIPAPREDACFVSSNRGAKMVLFGGFSANGLGVLRDIHVLDIATMSWSKGPDVGLKDQRGVAACGASNGYFIAWGGRDENKGASSTIVYDITNNTWTNTFVASSSPRLPRPTSSIGPVATPPPFDTPSTDGQEGSSNILFKAGVIVVVCAVVLILVILAVVLFRARRARNLQGSLEDVLSDMGTLSSSQNNTTQPPSYSMPPGASEVLDYKPPIVDVLYPPAHEHIPLQTEAIYRAERLRQNPHAVVRDR